MDEEKPPKLTMAQKRKLRTNATHGKSPRIKNNKVLKELNIHKPIARTRSSDVANMLFLKKELRETWHTLWESANEYKRYTEKQIRFAKMYALNGRRFIIRSMKEAGYEYGDDEQARLYAHRLLKRPGFDDLIRAFELEEKARMKLTVEDVVAWFQRIATAAMESGDYTNANRSLESLAKYLGMFVEKREITHKVIHSKQELDTRIAELTQILRDAEPEIEAKIRIN